MAVDERLQLRGQLIRSLGRLREMLPGSFVKSWLKCGKANCRCAAGKELHFHYVLSVLVDGKPTTFHIPADIAERVGKQVQKHKQFQEVEAKICDLNLQDFLREKEKRKKRGK